MFWADEIAAQIQERYAEKIKKGEVLTVRDEKTASGRVHIGSLRAAAIHGLTAQVLNEKGVKAKFLFEINDTDPMDGFPVGLDESFRKYMGQPLYTVPSPDGKAKNFAEFYAGEYKKVIESIGFEPEFYRLSDLYNAGKFNDVIRLALEHADKIREIYKRVANSEKPATWYPLNVICPKCGKVGTTHVSGFDGETVAFECMLNQVSWAEGCGEKGRISPFDGRATLPWKVEWAAKWAVVGVDIEGAGKDHYTKGGSRDVSRTICEEVFKHTAPFDIPHEFVLVGGKKMSSSKGAGASAKEISDLLPSEITRLLLVGKPPKRAIDFEPAGDTIPNLFDEFDRLEEIYFEGDESKADFARQYQVCFSLNDLPDQKPLFRPRFRDLAFLVQVPYVDIEEKLDEMKEAPLTADEKEAAQRRIEYVQKWLNEEAPEKFLFKISDELPTAKEEFAENDLRVLTEILNFFESKDEVVGQDLHGFFHVLKDKLALEPREIFVPIYKAFLGRESGPKAGFLLSALDRNFVIKRLKEIL